ncbi:MAG: efflux RND transporter permease subunit [Clostridiales bacterium]|nr:efflux RND transporter permease subunit [Clostridiales bacterium]
MLPLYSVRKPYTVMVAVILVIVLGVISFNNMTTDLLPTIEMPYIIVMTSYPGASPEKIEQTVTRPLEAVLGTASGIDQLREDGMEKREALLTAGVTRLRPILLTALTTILAMSTMALGYGEGAELVQPMAVVTVGGLTYSTLLTLFIVPVLYDIFNRKPVRKIDYGETQDTSM